MIYQVARRTLITHAIKNDINPFSAGKFCSGNKIAICCNHDDLIHLSLESERRYV